MIFTDIYFFRVSDPSKILRSPSAVTKNEGENALLTCQYEGKPISRVEWFFHGKKLDVASNSRLSVSETGDETNATSSLTISNLNRTDEGPYKCVVSNSIQANVSSSEAQLTVNCKLVSVLHAGCVVSDDMACFAFSDPADIVSSPRSTITNQSATVVLSCEVEGKPEPNVTWFKDGVEVNTSDSRISATHRWSDGRSESNLTIVNAHRSDKGSYHCRALNDIGAVANSSAAILTVNCKYMRLSLAP